MGLFDALFGGNHIEESVDRHIRQGGPDDSCRLFGDGAEYLSLAWPMYLGALGGIVIYGLSFAYFLKSERVAKTLIH